MIYVCHFFKTMKHKWYVLLAGRRLGVPIWQLIVHDLSKFSRAEWGPYARRFCKKNPAGSDMEDFRAAWRHHFKTSPHHWQYWINDPHGPRPMIKRYAREMVADWLGASRAYTGSWDMSDWLTSNWKKMILHSVTRQQVFDILEELGYERHYEDGRGRWEYVSR